VPLFLHHLPLLLHIFLLAYPPFLNHNFLSKWVFEKLWGGLFAQTSIHFMNMISTFNKPIYLNKHLACFGIKRKAWILKVVKIISYVLRSTVHTETKSYEVLNKLKIRY
jgi:hypothetical protein